MESKLERHQRHRAHRVAWACHVKRGGNLHICQKHSSTFHFRNVEVYAIFLVLDAALTFFRVGDQTTQFTMSPPQTTFWRLAGMSYLQVCCFFVKRCKETNEIHWKLPFWILGASLLIWFIRLLSLAILRQKVAMCCLFVYSHSSFTMYIYSMWIGQRLRFVWPWRNLPEWRRCNKKSLPSTRLHG